MERENLINEIASFGVDYEIFDNSIGIEEIKDNVSSMIDDITFIEHLIAMIVAKTKSHENADSRKVKLILLKLEKRRLELKYSDTGGSCLQQEHSCSMTM